MEKCKPFGIAAVFGIKYFPRKRTTQLRRPVDLRSTETNTLLNNMAQEFYAISVHLLRRCLELNIDHRFLITNDGDAQYPWAGAG